MKAKKISDILKPKPKQTISGDIFDKFKKNTNFSILLSTYPKNVAGDISDLYRIKIYNR